MKTYRLMAAWLGLLGWSAVPAAMAADGAPDVVVVNARVSDDYARVRRPDGTFQSEAYAFGEGGQWGGAMQDNTIDQLKFMDVARTIAGPLADQNYLPTKVASEAKLLIMVYWGTTAGTSGAANSLAAQNLGTASQHLASAKATAAVALAGGRSTSDSDKLIATVARQRAMAELDSALTVAQAENHQRERTDLENARMLGYNATGLIGTDYGRHLEYTALRTRERDIIEEVEDNRYFVVLMAYDFQLLLKKKQHKLMWETRFSIRERGNAFDQALAGMAQDASRYFGQDSHGLRRKPLPEGHVKLDELKILEVVPDR